MLGEWIGLSEYMNQRSETRISALKILHTVWFQLNDILGKVKLWRQRKVCQG